MNRFVVNVCAGQISNNDKTITFRLLFDNNKCKECIPT